MSIFKFLKRSKCFYALLLVCCMSISSINHTVYANTENQTDKSIVKSVYEGKNGQPYSLYWFPEQLLKWSPDATTAYNISHIPMAKRVDKDKLSLSNDTQSKQLEVVAISIMNSSTSGNPSQGSNKFSSNTFSYWQYIDKMVYWGGSSGEGIIVPPSPDVTDSAHKNGVPVLGTVFFPQKEHGGKIEWLNEVLTKSDNGTFPMADKLIEVANTLKFDGWFINQETQGANAEHSKLMQEFIKYFNSKAPKLEIMWYDSMVTNGEINWQNALNENNQMFLVDDKNRAVADTMFLNFWWNTKKYASEELLKNSNEYAKEINLNPYKLFAGIDVQAEGTKTPVMWELLDDKTNPYTSIGLYCPSWTYFSSSPDITGKLSEEEQHAKAEEFLQKESDLWVNGSGNPEEISNDEWKGISTYAVEKTTVTSLPFVTNFSLGNGTAYFADGKQVSNQGWNNRSLSDIMPTYRWVIDNPEGNDLKAEMIYTDAFNGGNSISLKGNMNSTIASTIKLYSADILIDKDTKFTSSFKSEYEDTIWVDLILDFYDNENAIISPDSKLTKDWNTINYNLSDYLGKRIKNISFRINKDSDIPIDIKLGNISITNKNDKYETTSNVVVKNVYSEDSITSGVSISIEDSKANDMNRYEIYRKTSEGSQFIGATVNPNYYISELKRNGKEDRTQFEVVSVDKNGIRLKGAEFEIKWDKYPIPMADFLVDNTLVQPNEKVQFTDISSETTESIEWTFEGADTEKVSGDKSPIVSYSKEGVYTVTLTAKNSSGDNTVVKEGIVTVSNNAEQKNDKLALNKKADATSFVNENEAPEFALDDSIKTKWCAVGDGPHAITIDLGKVCTISEIDIYHAEAGGENADFNTKGYTISTSIDKSNFVEMLKVTDNNKGITKDPIKAVKAQYIKINIDKPTQGGDTATRIYDIKVIGIE